VYLSAVRTRVIRWLVGAFSFLVVAVLLVGLHSYLDYQRLKQQEAFATPKAAFLSTDTREVSIEWSRGEGITIAGERVLTFDDFQIVAGQYGSREAIAWYLRTDDGWVRVPGESLTPFVVCAVRRAGKEVTHLFGLVE